MNIQEQYFEKMWSIINDSLQDEELMLSSHDQDNIEQIMEDYYQAKLKLLGIPNVSGWLDFNSNRDLFDIMAKRNCLCKFECGTEINYNEDHPFEVMTHFKLAI